MIINIRNSQKKIAAALRQRLAEGVVSFLYRKQDGTVRFARGTTSSKLFSYTFKCSDRRICADRIAYWDINKDAWRCCKVENIIMILNIQAS